ncbi:Uncharacterized protein QJS10_CPA01g00186 [Acorus calamus]|uniref:Glycosyltransferase n=1 Tax=Acorus calamus TaxID=4465 RepID=A0AAV9FK17_ACOCL|nr:Uncharacterized protein QJS10_CPA01g00186 [Acorus calamus]
MSHRELDKSFPPICMSGRSRPSLRRTHHRRSQMLAFNRIPPASAVIRLLLFAAAVGFPCAVIYHAASPKIPLIFSPPSGSPPVGQDPTVRLAPEPPEVDESDSDSEEVKLERVLRGAAMEDKTVILTTLNAAWASPNSMIDLFLESFLIGNGTRNLLDHLVIVALDEKAYARCLSMHPHCLALKTEGVDFEGEKFFMTPGYLKMMWRRIDFLRIVLEMGYNFIFTDSDIMWFRNPLPYFYPDGDFQIACDKFLGSPVDLQNLPNGGFNYVKSNNRTIEFYKFWYSSRERHPGSHDQDVLNRIKYDPYIGEIGVQLRFLSTAYFGGFCEPSRDLNKVCTMHANCCLGLESKLHDLRIMLDDWRNYMSLPPSVKKSHPPPWRVPQNCSIGSLQQH